MSIDSSNSSLAFGSAPRIGEVRRIDRESHPPHSGGKDPRDGRDKEYAHPTVDTPHDIVDVSAQTADPAAAAPVRRDHAPPPSSDRHIDIEV